MTMCQYEHVDLGITVHWNESMYAGMSMRLSVSLTVHQNYAVGITVRQYHSIPEFHIQKSDS